MSRYGKREDLIVHEVEPFNVETGLAALAAGPVTATDAFYVRGHGAVPELDAGRVPPAGPRARRAGAVALAADAARGLPRVRGDRHAAVRRQPPRRPDRDPRHPGRGAVGARRDGHRDVVGRPARRRARAGRPARGGRARGLRRRRPVPGGQAGAALRRLDPARQGAPARGAARVVHERRAADAGPRRAAARRGPGLHRRAQREVAGADRAAREPVGRLLPARRLPAAARGRHAGRRAAGSRSGSWR